LGGHFPDVPAPWEAGVGDGVGARSERVEDVDDV
jgi:hypothetical protein